MVLLRVFHDVFHERSSWSLPAFHSIVLLPITVVIHPLYYALFEFSCFARLFPVFEDSK